MSAVTTELRVRTEQALRHIGAAPDLLERRRLPLFADASELALAHVSQSGREHFLLPAAAEAWASLREAARNDAVALVMISGFRSFERQLELIERKLAAGEAIDDILAVMAPPGCSEHHSGRAADVGTPGCDPLSERFEQTAAFAWLASKAGDYGFRLSYPRENPFGFRYEPWHWCYQR